MPCPLSSKDKLIITLAIIASWGATLMAIFTNNFWWVVGGMLIAFPAWIYSIYRTIEVNNRRNK